MVALVQSAVVDGSASLAYAGSVTAGNFLCCIIRNGVATAPTSVSDTVNGGWTKALNRLNDAGTSDTQVSLWYRTNTAAGTPTVSHNGSGSSRMIVAEYSGMGTTPALDVNASDSDYDAVGLAVWGGANVTVPASALLAVGGTGDGNNGVTGFDLPFTQQATTAKTRLAHVIGPTAGSLTLSGTGTLPGEGNIISLFAVFIPGSGQSTVPVKMTHYRYRR